MHTHDIAIDQNIHAQFAEFLLQGMGAIAFFMGEPAYPFDKTGTLTNRCQGNKRRK